MDSSNSTGIRRKTGQSGDRQKFFETFEATRTQNEKTIKELSAENVELRKKYAALNMKAAAKGPNTDDDIEIRNETAKADKLRTECDKIVATSREKEKLVRKLLDESIILEQQSQRPAAEDTPLGRKIRILENRLDKAMIKYNEAQSIRKTYEQIVKRLQEEKMNSENQMTVMDNTLKAKNNDIEELISYSSNAMHSKDYALQQLEQAEYKYKIDHQSREKQLKERETIKKQRDESRKRTELREKMKQDLINKKSEDLLATHHDNDINNGADSQQLRSQLEKYENSFRKIKEATGVSDINEVLTKFISQDDTRNELEALSKDNSNKIELLTKERDELKQRVDDMKYAIAGGRVGSRKIVDELEKSLSSAQMELDRQKQKYDRLTKTLIEAKAGISHLGSKLNVNIDESNKDKKDDVVHILNLCEEKLLSMMKVIEEKGGDINSILDTNTDIDNIDTNRPHNIRVNINEEDSDITGGEGGDGGDTDIGALTRDQIKLASQSVIKENTMKHRKKKNSDE